MQAKLVKELNSREGHFLSFSTMGVILVIKTNVLVIKMDNTLIGDGHPVRIPSEVFDYVMDPGERFFGKNYPLFFVEGFFPMVKSLALGRKPPPLSGSLGQMPTRYLIFYENFTHSCFGLLQ